MKPFVALADCLLRRIHRRDTEVVEFVVFLDQALFTPRPPRLDGAMPSPALEEILNTPY